MGTDVDKKLRMEGRTGIDRPNHPDGTRVHSVYPTVHTGWIPTPNDDPGLVPVVDRDDLRSDIRDQDMATEDLETGEIPFDNVRNTADHASLGIPESFQLLGHTIKVIIEDTTDVGKFGDADFNLNIIRLFPAGTVRDVIRHTYFHEVVHFLLHYSGHPELAEDEVLVDVLGGLIAQLSKGDSGL